MSALHKVLVVDDDPVIGKSFDRVLTAKGYTVITAPDAADALERLRDEEVDLVVTDIRMPGMSGIELAETVKARRPWMPVLIVTGYGNASDEARARAAGVSAFLHKPLSPEQIEGSTEDAIARATAPMPLVTADEAVAPVAVEAEAPVKGGRIRDIALFFAAPLIGFLYVVVMPFVGLAALGWFGAKAIAKKFGRGRVATVAKMIAAPFVGLAYLIVLPFAGIGALAWVAGRTLFERIKAE